MSFLLPRAILYSAKAAKIDHQQKGKCKHKSERILLRIVEDGKIPNPDLAWGKTYYRRGGRLRLLLLLLLRL